MGHDISDTTVGTILKAHGIEPAPERKRQTTWKTFLKAHWDVLASVDFTTIEVWTKSGLVTFYLLFVMEVASRRVHFAGCTANPDDAWMRQVARNLTDGLDGFLNGKKYLIMDRDTKYTEAFCRTIEESGTECLKLPPRSPNLSPHIERFMRSLKSEALSRLIFFGEDSLRRAAAGPPKTPSADAQLQTAPNDILKTTSLPFRASTIGVFAGQSICTGRPLSSPPLFSLPECFCQPKPTLPSLTAIGRLVSQFQC